MMPIDVMANIMHYAGYTGQDNILAHTYSLVCKDWRDALCIFRWATLTTAGIPTEERFHALTEKLRVDSDYASLVK